MFRKFLGLKKRHQLTFSILVLSGVICFWRGFYGLLDKYLIPGDLNLSYILSIFFGLVILGATHYTIDKLV